MGFIDQMRAEGHAVESIIRVLCEQGVKIATKTYRAWSKPRVVARTITDARVVDAVRNAAWMTVGDAAGVVRRKMTAEGLYRPPGATPGHTVTPTCQNQHTTSRDPAGQP